MRLLIDMYLSPNWADFLAASGLESEHWSKIGPANATDSEITAFAKAHDMVVLTHDLDFSAILAASRGAKPSVIQIRAENISVKAIGNAVIGALNQMAAELEHGALLTIDPKRTRLRLLPLTL